jgi:hypothetical protein
MIQALKFSLATGSPRAGNSLSFIGRTSTCFSLQLLVPKPVAIAAGQLWNAFHNAENF